MDASLLIYSVTFILFLLVFASWVEYKRPISKFIFKRLTPKLKQLQSDSLNKNSPFLETDPSLWIAQSDNAFAIKDIRPRAPHHYLIIPKQHCRSVLDTDPAVLGEMLGLCREVALENGFAEDGFRIVINTNPHGLQTVYHLHMHLMGGRQMRLPVG